MSTTAQKVTDFAKPIAIIGTQKEIEVIIPYLLKLGYSWWEDNAYHTYHDGNALTTNYTGFNGALGYCSFGERNMHDRFVLNANNPAFVIAVAAMRNNSVFSEKEFAFSKTRKTTIPYEVFGLVGRYVNDTESRKATFEEIRDYFQKLSDIDLLAINKTYLTLTSFQSKTTQKTKEFNRNKDVVEYTVIEEFPNSPALGTILTRKDESGFFYDAKHNQYLEGFILKGVPKFFKPTAYKEDFIPMQVRCRGKKSIEVRVSKDGIYVPQEKIWVDISVLKSLVLNLITLNLRVSKTHHLINCDAHNIGIEYITIGCTNDVYLNDIKNVLDRYNRQFVK